MMDKMEFDRQFNRVWIGGATFVLVWILGYIAFVVGCLYVAWHFISKWW